MSTLEAKQKNTMAVAFRWSIALLLLLVLFVPVPVLAVPPDVRDDAFSVQEDSDDDDPENQLDVLFNDEPLPGVPFIIVGVTQGTHGRARVIGGGTLVTYQPDPDFYGTDQFTYVVPDGSGDFLRATVRITVRGINDPPIARDDTATTPEDQSVIIDVLDNDTDIDGTPDPGTVRRVSGPSNGRVTVNQRQLTLSQLTEILKRVTSHLEGQTVIVRGDAETRHQDIMSVLDACTKANVWMISFAALNDPPVAKATSGG